MLKRLLIVALRMALVTLLLCGLAYPLLVTGVAGIVFPRQAAGSLVTRDAEVVGSALIGQAFAGENTGTADQLARTGLTTHVAT